MHRSKPPAPKGIGGLERFVHWRPIFEHRARLPDEAARRAESEPQSPSSPSGPVAILAALVVCRYHPGSVSGLPDHEPERVLPPYVGGILDGELQSPYEVTAAENVERYAITEKRRTMLRGLF